MTNRDKKNAVMPIRAHVLIAEDQSENILIAAHILENCNCTYKIANDGAEALAALKKETFDLVLMDVTMPEIDGLESTRRIRAFEQNSGKKHVPIVALTSHTFVADRETCLESGMDEFLSKPLYQDQFELILEKFTSTK